MKFPFSASALLAATISLALVGASDPIPPVCGTEQPLIVNGQDFGHFKITERNGGLLTVVVNIAGQDLTNEEALSFPYITEIRAQTYCSMEGADDTGHSPMKIFRYHQDDYELAASVAEFMIQEPECSEGWATDIKIQADIEEPGGITAFNGLFPVEGIDVKFRVESLDRGDGETASYFDASFAVNSDLDAAVVEALENKKFDGYCVDAGTIIYKNYWYDAKAYSFLNQDWDSLGRHAIGNIDKPWKMDNVAYCINHWHEGTTYNNPNPALYPNAAPSYKLSSGTMQTIIWQLVDDKVNDLGTTADLEWAKIIFDDCEDNGGGFEPGCNDKIPLVVVPVYTGGDAPVARQNQYVQTTFAQLDITCHGATGMGQAEAACMPGGTGESGGDPHFKTFGNEWFDFHGGCDLLLADFPDFAAGLGLTAEVRTTTRYDYSFIEGAAVKIGEDILQVFSHGQYLLNGMAQVEAPFMIGDYLVEYTQPRKHQHIFSIDLGGEKNINIVIKVYKDLVYITLNVQDGASTEFQEGTGMLGSWFNGTRFARDGVSVMLDNNEYGQEWQVRDTDQKLFSVDRAPQWPVQCEMPKAVERASRRLGETVVSAEEASTACAQIKNQHKHDMCVFDVIATSDLSVAQGGSY